MSTDAELRFQPDDLVERFLGAVEWYFKTVAQELWGNIAEEAPVRTGRLAGSWKLNRAGRLEWSVASDAEYAAAVQDGTDPHDIVAKRAKALAFEVDGEMVVVRRVRHPGTKANPYIDRAIERVEERLEDFAAQAIDRLG